MLDELECLVRMESPSREAVAIRALVDRLASEFAAAGATVEVHDGHAHGPNLVARYGQTGRPVMLLGHTDTVWPLGTLAEMPWRVARGRAHGPGVFDMKAGCLMALETVRGLAAHGLRPPLEILFNCDEEIGSESSRKLIETEARESRCVLVLEPSIPGGAAKTSRSGMADYRIVLSGVASHAGVDPDKGVSAVVAAAEIVLALADMNDPENGVSVNAGVIAGGTRPNVIAAACAIDVDVRFRTETQGRLIDERIRGLSPARVPARIDVTGGIDRPPLEATPASRALFESAARAARASGFEMGEGHVGGVSDGNFTAALGIPTLDGLGVDGLGAHALHEQIVVEDLPRRVAMLTRLVLEQAA
jgi:glutamate carboxypeptidase